jgi:predicted ATP-grasp superfamily ATP-dependent carboligase
MAVFIDASAPAFPSPRPLPEGEGEPSLAAGHTMAAWITWRNRIPDTIADSLARLMQRSGTEGTGDSPIAQRSRSGTRAIILGIEHPRAVAAVQSLGRAGIPVLGVDHDSAAIGFFSRYLHSKHRIDRDPERALAFLDELGRDDGGMLMPTNDHYLILVSKNLDRLSKHFVVTTPPWEALGPLMDVSRCYEMARGLGIRTPNFFKAESEEEMRRIVSSLDLERHEYILKTMPGSAPADARTARFTKVAGVDRGTIAHDCLEIFSRAGEFPTILEVVPGTADRCIGVCMMVDQNHDAVLCYAVKRLKLHTYSKGGRFVHPYEMGANVYCESIHDEEAAEAARRLVHRARYQGPIAIEFRRDPADGSLVLIKADPRFVRATSLSTAIGLDMPTALYRVFSSRRAGKQVKGSSYSDGIAWIWLTSYLTALWANRSDRSLLRELFRLARNLRKIKAVAYLDLGDPLPFLVSLKRWLWSWTRSLAKGLTRRLARWGRRPVSLPAS